MPLEDMAQAGRQVGEYSSLMQLTVDNQQKKVAVRVEVAEALTSVGHQMAKAIFLFTLLSELVPQTRRCT